MVTTRSKWALCLIAFLFPAVAWSQVFKCVSSANEISIQSRACPPSWKGEDLDAPADFALIIRAYDEMSEKLKKGDVDGALLHFTESARPRYRKIFETLGNRLPDATDRLGRVVGASFSDSTADLTVERNTPTGKRAFSVQFLKWGGRTWLIDGM